MQWDQFIKHSPQSNPFSYSSWLKVYSNVFNVPVHFICKVQDQEIINGIIYFAKKRASFSLSPVMPIGLYHGVFFHEAEWKNIFSKPQEINMSTMKTLDEIENQVHFYSTTLHPSLSTSEFTLNKLWKSKLQHTLIVDIASVDECWNNFNQSLRRKIRRAIDQRIQIVETYDVRILVDQHLQSYRRQKIEPSIEERVLVKWLNRLVEDKLVRIFEARIEDTVVASRAVVLHKDTVYDFLAGINSVVETHNASHFLVWKIIEKMSHAGFKYFDFMGANTPGPTEFKKSFGGKLVPYYQLTYYRSRSIRSLERIRNFMIKKQRKLK